MLGEDKILVFKLRYELDNFSGLIEVSKEKLPPSQKKGIYFLYDENKQLIYLGKATSCISTRLNQHLFHDNPYFGEGQYTFFKRQFYKYFAYSEIEKYSIKNIEKRLILKFKPKFNIQYNDSFDYSLKYKPLSKEQQDELNDIFLNL